MIIAITGAFGSGKSLACSHFQYLGWEIYSADAMCHDIYPEIAGVLAARWEEDIRDASGALNRRKIGEIVFGDPAEMDFLLGLLYPELWRQIAAIRAGSRGKFIAIELPLLFEYGKKEDFDKVVALYSRGDLRQSRLAGRGFSPEEVAKRDRCQLNPDEKLLRADYAVINNGSGEDLKIQVAMIDLALRQDERISN